MRVSSFWIVVSLVLHAAFQQQKHANSFSLSCDDFFQICVAREQALGERKRELQHAIIYAGSGVADVFGVRGQ